jgi:AraC-like DNA-binding protein
MPKEPSVTNPVHREKFPIETIIGETQTHSRATSVAMVAMMPSGELRVIRPSGVGQPFVRTYAQSGQFVDSVSWAAMLTGKAVHSSEFFSEHTQGRQTFHSMWLGKLGMSHSVSVPLTSPILAGYPAVLIAVRGVGHADFTAKDIDAVAQGAARIDAQQSSRLSKSVSSALSTRAFVASEGRFIGRSPTSLAMDPLLAEAIERHSLQRLVDDIPSDNSGGDRLMLADSRNELHAFRLLSFDQFPAITQSRVVIVAKVPSYDEWLTLNPADFAADDEFVRLIPSFRFMYDHYQKGITLPQISKSVHLSPFHFHRRFTEQLGITPKHFLFDCQIAQAQELLLKGTTELEDIAKLCGFAHQSHFTSRFKQATGLTPTRWTRMKHNARHAAQTRAAINA